MDTKTACATVIAVAKYRGITEFRKGFTEYLLDHLITTASSVPLITAVSSVPLVVTHKYVSVLGKTTFNNPI